MFLHSGASLHGHEYSQRTAQAGNAAIAPRRSPLLRSIATPISRSSSEIDTPRRSSLRAVRRLSDFTPRPGEQTVRFQEPEEPVDEPQPAPDTRRQSQMTEDADVSLSGSELSDATLSTDATATTPRHRRKRRVSHQAKTYVMASPAPKFADKSEIVRRMGKRVRKPKLYLQMQRLSEGQRPRPTIDVYSPAVLAASRLARVLGVRELQDTDVVLVNSENYSSGSYADDSDDEDLTSQRRLIAVLSPLKKEDRTEIVFADSTVWIAQPNTVGSFDFTHYDQFGNATTARWARRQPVKGKPAGMASQAPATPEPSETRFTFSIINPLVRRHPIMATLTQESLQIQDDYTTVSSSAGRYPPSKSMHGRSHSAAAVVSPLDLTAGTPGRFMDDDGDSAVGMREPWSDPTERRTLPVDEATKTLISVTAVWVALRLGWSPYYRFSHVQAAPAESNTVVSPPATVSTTTPTTSARASRRGTFNRTDSESTDIYPAYASGQRADSIESPSVSSQRQSTQSFCARKGVSLPLQPRGPSPLPSGQSTPISATAKILPRRATSTGAAFVQRRIQQQNSDMSESDAPGLTSSMSVTRKARNRGARILSGEWAGLNGNHNNRISRVPSNNVGMEASPTPSPQPISPTDSSVFVPRAAGASAELRRPVEQVQTHPQAHSVKAILGGRRTQSAFYASTPIRLEEDQEFAIQTGSVNGMAPTTPVLDGVGLVMGGVSGGSQELEGHKPGISAKFRSVGNWFRRLGVH